MVIKKMPSHDIIVKRDFSDWRERREVETELRTKFYSIIKRRQSIGQ